MILHYYIMLHQGVNYAGCPHPGGDPGRWGGNVTVQWRVRVAAPGAAARRRGAAVTPDSSSPARGASTTSSVGRSPGGWLAFDPGSGGRNAGRGEGESSTDIFRGMGWADSRRHRRPFGGPRAGAKVRQGDGRHDGHRDGRPRDLAARRRAREPHRGRRRLHKLLPRGRLP